MPVKVSFQTTNKSIHQYLGIGVWIEFHVSIGELFQCQQSGLVIVPLHKTRCIALGKPLKLLKEVTVSVIRDDSTLVLVRIMQNYRISPAINCCSVKVGGIFMNEPLNQARFALRSQAIFDGVIKHAVEVVTMFANFA